MAEFHFLRPLWLGLLPVALWAAWRFGMGRGGASGWRAVVDKALQPYVLTAGETVRQRSWPVLTVLLAAVLAILALAGPTWDRLTVPAYRSDESLVLALDLSRSMDATDVAPTRLARAKLKLLDLLERREGGQTALVVFSSNAFTVTPLTSDTRTIASLINSLSTDIMPSRGSLMEVGLEKSAELLRQIGATRGEILVVTDATPSPRSITLAGSLSGNGITTSVLAVGTEQGAPIPVLGGGFLTDATGQVVVPQLNLDSLERVAIAGGGRFAVLSAGDSDLDRLFPGDVLGQVATDDGQGQREAEIWRDQGIWLCLILLPLIALGFRRGWVYVVVGALCVPESDALAFEWSDLWLRGDQQGYRAMQQDAPEQAAALFTDPEWLAAAQYRAGQYEQSAMALAGIDTAEANYNRGNALARSGQLAEAVDAYDRALELAPDHADAEFNRELVADLLEQQQQQQQDQQDQGQQQDSEGESETGADQEQEGEQSQQPSAGDSGQDEEQMANQQQDQQSGQDPGSEPENQEPGSEPEPSEADDEGQQLAAAASPEEIEDWASEQAADQWLRRIPQDPGGLLRRKFLYQYQQLGLDQDGNRIYPGSEAEPW
jgi:Ca-activated chloride channel family protein